MTKCGLQPPKIKAQEAFGCFIALFQPVIPEQTALLLVRQLKPLMGTETLVQEIHTVLWNVRIPCDKPVDCHGKGEVDDHVDFACLGKGFDRVPFKMQSIWIQKCYSPRIGRYAKSAGKLLNTPIGVYNCDMHVLVRVFILKVMKQRRSTFVGIKEVVLIKTTACPESA